MQSRKYDFAYILGLMSVFFFSCSSTYFNPDHMGAFLLEDSRLISIRKSEGNTLRYRIFQNGSTGRLYQEGLNTYVSGKGFANKEPTVLTVQYLPNSSGKMDSIIWKETGSPPLSGKKVNRDEKVTLMSHGNTLHGRMDLPEGYGPFPAIILVHGSGKDKATDYYYNGDFFAAKGIATLTFDKRGTGKSGGEYTFDYYKLAQDVISGIEYLSNRKDIDPHSIGLSGYSQGGWVAPLAAALSSKVKFLLINYGMIESAIQEALLETQLTLNAKGLSKQDLEEATELSLATINVVASGFKKGWEQVEMLKNKYKNAKWRPALKGTTVDEFLKYPRWLIKLIGPGKAPAELDWFYDSTQIFDTINIPMVWLLAESDTAAPNELTLSKLERYQRMGRPIDIQVFPNTDHNMLLYEEIAGKRVYTSYDPDYFNSEVEYAWKFIGKGKHNPQ